MDCERHERFFGHSTQDFMNKVSTVLFPKTIHVRQRVQTLRACISRILQEILTFFGTVV